MRLALTVFSAISLTSLSIATPSAPQLASADVLYWPVTSSQPSSLARISYDVTSLTSDVISFSPPNPVDHNNKQQSEIRDQNEDLVRVGLYISTPENSRQWVGTLTTRSSLAGNGGIGPTLRLHLDPSDNEVYQVSVLPPLSATNASGTVNPTIELVSSEVGPYPHLNRPIVVGPDGKNSEELIEKTFFQK
ncbi:hypothetical protein ASPWEDRAFT_43196 [Aspergillus wentii DTO 134E9]|uniref:Uncharacterized protein n=1 Tax=Aspergillus wentii DTO 134E9 TaxID=1073089 RepID=A0A1L9RDX4_ASPWE|nr:uncharacterized protein ASPWEDRAFT_43196 [Aspergillus wentii DTO 134E9]KAI9933389.1 hypothetical protein MW887_007862 [Aspergillus wentii]OJJ33126.1 hypothetical protein ASPWEDRAFT_43196 [Aspergillus wentii DTO 134E9]